MALYKLGKNGNQLVYALEACFESRLKLFTFYKLASTIFGMNHKVLLRRRPGTKE